VKKSRRMGWLMDHFRKNANRCPLALKSHYRRTRDPIQQIGKLTQVLMSPTANKKYFVGKTPHFVKNCLDAVHSHAVYPRGGCWNKEKRMVFSHANGRFWFLQIIYRIEVLLTLGERFKSCRNRQKMDRCPGPNIQSLEAPDTHLTRLTVWPNKENSYLKILCATCPVHIVTTLLTPNLPGDLKICRDRPWTIPIIHYLLSWTIILWIGSILVGLAPHQ